MGKLLIVLRWSALAVALVLNVWGPWPAGFIYEPGDAIFAVALYNVAASFALVRWRWLIPRRLLILDTVAFTAGIVATGGWHSSLFVLYYLTVLAAAVRLRPVEGLGYTGSVSLVYLAACVALPNWDWTSTAVEVLIERVLSLLFIGLIATTLVQQVEAERQLRRTEEGVNSRLTVLNELMSLELGSKLDLGKTLDAVARLARGAISAEFCAVCLFPGRDHPGFHFAFDGVPEPQQADLFRTAHLDPIGEVVARTGQPLLIADISRVSGEALSLPSFHQCRTLVCVPIKLEDSVIGVLYNGVRSPEQVTQTEVDLLVTMGRYTGLAIANAEMYHHERGNAQRLQRLEQMKSQFLSTVSHQLRTPITSIATSADLLAASDGNLNEDQRRLVQNVVRNSLRLDNLVADLLEMARLRDGRLRLARQPLSPLALINETVAAMRVLLEARSQILQVKADPALPKVDADRKRIEHALTNLLSNASKFTQRGGVIAVEAVEREKVVEFIVRDNGPGMDADARERAFEPFFSASGPDGQGGTGLGLAIARGLVKLHGGEIVLESALGAGTTVRFTLPQASDE